MQGAINDLNYERVRANVAKIEIKYSRIRELEIAIEELESIYSKHRTNEEDTFLWEYKDELKSLKGAANG